MAKHEEDNEEIKISFGWVKKNPWILVSIFLAIVVVCLLIFGRGESIVSPDTAANNLVSFIEQQAGSSVEIVSVERVDSLYLVNVNFEGEVVPVYVTLDGKNLVSSLVPIQGNVGNLGG